MDDNEEEKSECKTLPPAGPPTKTGSDLTLDEVILAAEDVSVMLELISNYGKQVCVSVCPSEAPGRFTRSETFTRSDVSALTLGFERGTMTAAQLRYEFDQTSWLDTMIPTGDGTVRVVRVPVKD